MNTRNYQLRSAGSQRVRSGGTLRMDGVPTSLSSGKSNGSDTSQRLLT